VLPTGEVGIDPRLERCQPLLLELAGHGDGERLHGEVGERQTAPELERVAKRPRSLVGPAGVELASPPLGEHAEALEVALLGCDLEDVSRRSRGEPGVRLQGFPETRDMLLQRGLRVCRRVLTPELVDQAIAGDGLARVENEDREDASLLHSSEAKLALALPDFEGAEDAEVQAARQSANVPRVSGS
jgi:hypothetical protein